ncbi:MAG TPA: DoxX family protein [bacterium]|nr:DoxX family protein [bacterium]
MLDLGLLILRVALGITFIPHGWMKLNPNGPMKGPAGFGGFLKQMGVPVPGFLAWVVALLETVGAVLLIAGLGTRVLALGFVIDMIVAIILVKRRMQKVGFMDQKGGWEFEFALMAQALALIFTGAGSIALDRMYGL